MYRSLRKVAVGRVEKEETVEKKKKKRHGIPMCDRTGFTDNNKNPGKIPGMAK